MTLAAKLSRCQLPPSSLLSSESNLNRQPAVTLNKNSLHLVLEGEKFFWKRTAVTLGAHRLFWQGARNRAKAPGSLQAQILQRDGATGESNQALVVRRAFLDCIISKSQYFSYLLFSFSSIQASVLFSGLYFIWFSLGLPHHSRKKT